MGPLWYWLSYVDWVLAIFGLSGQQWVRVGLALVCVALIGAVWTGLHDGTCSTSAIPWPLGLVLTTVSIGSFGAGLSVGRVKWVRRGTTNVTGRFTFAASTGLEPSSIGRKTKLAVQVALVLFLLGGTLALLYESVAVSALGPPEPITSYVRCFSSSHIWAAAVAAGFFCFLLGHWFWYPRHDARD